MQEEGKAGSIIDAIRLTVEVPKRRSHSAMATKFTEELKEISKKTSSIPLSADSEEQISDQDVFRNIPEKLSLE